MDTWRLFWRAAKTGMKKNLHIGISKSEGSHKKQTILN